MTDATTECQFRSKKTDWTPPEEFALLGAPTKIPLDTNAVERALRGVGILGPWCPSAGRSIGERGFIW